MVVDDDEPVADVLRDFVLELGHQPLVLRSAEAALARLSTDRPDVILLDVNLPGMTGLEFLELGPVRESRVPIIVVSGVVTETQARACLRLGALDFLAKPVSLERLAAVLDFLQPQALEHEAGENRHPRASRPPRARVAVPVRVADYRGGEWTGQSVNLSAVGMKVASNARLTPTTAVRLTFTPPDGGAPFDVTALLVRNDPDGDAFYFVNVAPVAGDRLAAVVRRLATG